MKNDLSLGVLLCKDESNSEVLLLEFFWHEWSSTPSIIFYAVLFVAWKKIKGSTLSYARTHFAQSNFKKIMHFFSKIDSFIGFTIHFNLWITSEHATPIIIFVWIARRFSHWKCTFYANRSASLVIFRKFAMTRA